MLLAPPTQRQHLRLAGAVLAGGASRRMGRNKAALVVDGVPMLHRVAATLAAAGCLPVAAVGGDLAVARSVDLDLVPDRWPGEGPLGGILTALAWADGPVFVVATDMPWLHADSVRAVIDAVERVPDPGCDVAIAESGRLEPLCAFWMPSSYAPLLAAFDSGERSVHRAIIGLRSLLVPVDPGSVINVNRPDDLQHDLATREVPGEAPQEQR